MTEWMKMIIAELLIIISAIFLLNGKGAGLVGWYNVLSKNDQEKFDKVALCKFFGKIMLIIGILLPVLTIAEIYDISWLYSLLVTVVVVLAIFAVSYSRMSRRFRKNIQESRQLG